MKLKIHPLFFLFGIYFALIGKVFLFLTYTLTALLHEYGHAAAAERLGYRMTNITLMPYGAVVNGAIGGLSYKDELSVALAGPLTNFAICVLFACFWWLIPESYPYTETAFFANLSIATINLLPAFPLDGGRIISAGLSLKLRRKTVVKLMKISGIVISVSLLGLFIYSLFTKPNPSILFFAVFVFIGAIQKLDNSSYVRIYMKKNGFLGGIKECRRYLVSGSLTLRTLMRNLNGGYVYYLDIATEKGVTSLTHAQTQSLLASYRYDEKINEIIKTQLSH